MNDAKIVAVLVKWMRAEAERQQRKSERKLAYLLACRLGGVYVEFQEEGPYDNGAWKWNLSHAEMTDEQRRYALQCSEAHADYRRAASTAGSNLAALRRMLERKHDLSATANPAIAKDWAALFQREKEEQERQMQADITNLTGIEL